MPPTSDPSGSPAILDVFASWFRFVLIITVIVADATYDELNVIRAEVAMLIRWFWNIVRDDLRRVVCEPLRLIARRHAQPVKE